MKILKTSLVIFLCFMLNIVAVLATSTLPGGGTDNVSEGDDVIVVSPEGPDGSNPNPGGNPGNGNGNGSGGRHVPIDPSDGSSWGGNQIGIGELFHATQDDLWQLFDSSGNNFSGNTRTTTFLDKVEFTFEKQGGSMSRAQVNVGNSLNVMTQLNPEIMNKYTDVAGNSLNYEWNSNRKLTLYFADTIEINNYEDIREFAHNSTGFSPALYLQNLQLDVILLYFYLQYT